MELSKVCRFLIVVFSVLSVFFFVMFKIEERQDIYLSDEFVVQAVHNLSQSGVSVSESVIERRIPEKTIYGFEVNPSEKYSKKMSDTLITAMFGSNLATTEFDTPAGASLGVYDKNDDSRELGRVVFSDADFSFVISRNSFGMSGGDDPILSLYDEDISRENIEFIDKLCGKLCDGKKLGYRITGSSFDEQYLIVTVLQTVDGHDIEDAYMNFVFTDNTPVIITGRWVAQTPAEMYNDALLDGVNVLYELDLEKVTAIEAERIVYSLRRTENNKCFLVPEWEIRYKTSDGNTAKSYFDGL